MYQGIAHPRGGIVAQKGAANLGRMQFSPVGTAMDLVHGYRLVLMVQGSTVGCITAQKGAACKEGTSKFSRMQHCSEACDMAEEKAA